MKRLLPFSIRLVLSRTRSVFGFINLVNRYRICMLNASISRYASARLWRHIKVGEGVIVERGTHFHTNDNGPGHRIVIQNGTFIGPNCFFSAGELIQIGEHCNIGATSHLLAAGHSYEDPTRTYLNSPVVSYGLMRLGANSWIGAGSILLGGIDIGFGSVVAAGSLVRQSLPPLCLAGGQPARIIKVFDWVTKRWIQLPSDDKQRRIVLELHLSRIPAETDYILQLKTED